MFGGGLLFLLAYLLFFQPQASSGTAWYVDNKAGGSNNGASWEDAWTSLKAIQWNRVKPGDTIYISGGPGRKIYDEELDFDRSGKDGAPITIDSGANSPLPAGHSGEVIIDGESYCILANGSYNTIRGITCQNATRSGIRIEGTGSIVENTVVRDSTVQGIHVHYCDGCIVRDNRITTPDNVLQQTDGIAVYDSSNTLVEKNWIKITNQNNCEQCHSDGIQASFKRGSKYRDITIRYNYVENTKASSDNAQGIYLTYMQGEIKIVGNIVLVPDGGQAVCSRLLNKHPVNVSVVGNTIRNGGYWNLRVEDDDPLIQNNIIWQTGGSEAFVKDGAIIRLDGRAETSDAARIDHNLLYAPYTSGSVFFLGGTGIDWAAWQSQGFDMNSPFANPGLDICLRPVSRSAPGVGTGAVLDAEYGDGITLALCGQKGPNNFLPVRMKSRTSGGSAGWDIGAYVFDPGNLATTGQGPLLPFPLKIGDASGDGKVNHLDYLIWLKNFQPGTEQNGGFASGDFNQDAKVDGVDFTLWLFNDLH